MGVFQFGGKFLTYAAYSSGGIVLIHRLEARPKSEMLLVKIKNPNRQGCCKVTYSQSISVVRGHKANKPSYINGIELILLFDIRTTHLD